MPPTTTYIATPKGIRKHAAMVFMPVRLVTVADPPRTSIEDTMMFVANPKNMKTKWASFPHRVAMISNHVCAYGAFNLSFAANWANKRICTVAPAAYHHGPDIPYL